MDLQTSSSVVEVEMSFGSTQPTIVEEKVERDTGSETPAQVLPSLAASAPELRETPDSGGSNKTLFATRETKSMPEISVQDVQLTPEEFIRKKLTALITSMELSGKSEHPEKDFSDGSSPLKKSEVESGLQVQVIGAMSQTTSSDTSQITPSDSTPSAPRDSTPSAPRDSTPSAPRDSTPSAPRDSTPSAPRDSTPSAPRDSTPSAPRDSTPSAPFATRTLVPRNTPESSIEDISSRSMSSLDSVSVYRKTPGERETKKNTRTPSKIVSAIKTTVTKKKGKPEAKPSGLAQTPALTITENIPTESTPEMRADMTHVVHKTETSVEEALRISCSVGTCALPVVDVLPPPPHYPIGSSAMPKEPQDPKRLQVPGRLTFARARRGGPDKHGDDDNRATYMLCLIGLIFAVVVFDNWRRGT